MRALGLAWRLLLREWRAGELRILALSLIVAVAGVSAVAFFGDRVRLAMERQSGELLAADLAVESRAEFPSEWLEAARRQGLRTAFSQSFRTVLTAGTNFQLVEVKAVSPDYPLRGSVRVADTLFGEERAVAGGPGQGRVWLDPRLFQLLGETAGASVGLGKARLTIEQVIAFEPDRGANLFSIAPRLMMNIGDVPGTALLGEGSLVTYRLLLAGEQDALDAYQRWLRPRLRPGDRVLSGREARPEIEAATGRAERFLGLAALVSVLLAGVAAATAAHRHAERHLDSSAMLRCLGASRRFIAVLYTLQLLLLGLGASALGCALGFGAQAVLGEILGTLLSQPLPHPPLWGIAYGFATGLITLAGFALPPILASSGVSPLRVLRRDLGPLRIRGVVIYGAALTALGGLMLWQAGSLRLAANVFLGEVGTIVVLAAAAAALVHALQILRRRPRSPWLFGLVNIPRRAKSSIIQVVAFGLGIMVLLLLSLVREDLLEVWRDSVPADAPNQFLINIQPDQRASIEAFLAQRLGAAPRFHPMVRGRLAAIDGRPVSPEDYPSPRAQRLVQREFNLSWAQAPAADNRIVAGAWWNGSASGEAQWSVEQGLAETLGVGLGDRLRFLVAGKPVEGTVSSLRAVEWDSFRVNFFVLAPPGVLEGEPATYITSFYLSQEQRAILSELVKRFPNVTVIDVDAIMSHVRAIIDRVVMAVQFIFVFTLLAGIMVLMAAIQSTHDERLREAAVLRTLGASHRQVRISVITEFLTLGILAGLLAGVAAAVLGFVLGTYVFELDYRPSPFVIAAGILGGTAMVGLAGLWGTRKVLRHPPLKTLRET